MQLIIPARSPRFFRAKIRKDGGKGPAEGEGELTLAERAACFKCGSPRVFFATTENDDEKRWREFVCKQCYIRLDLRFSEELYHRVLRCLLIQHCLLFSSARSQSHTLSCPPPPLCAASAGSVRARQPSAKTAAVPPSLSAYALAIRLHATVSAERVVAYALATP